MDAEWSFYTRIYGGTSASNLTRFHILTADSLTADGYYIQVGGNNDNITFYTVRNGTNNKVIEHADRKQVIPQDDADIYVRLTRGQDGVFHLYSLVEHVDNDYVEEGTYPADNVQAQLVALCMKNSSKRGYDLYWDDISVSGEPQTESAAASASDLPLTLSSDCLSLHGEGHDAEISIAYTCPDDTYKATMQVYSADGRLMRTCYEADPLESSGKLTWNGKKNNDEQVEIGVYVIILEITSSHHPSIRKRYPIAVLH